MAADQPLSLSVIGTLARRVTFRRIGAVEDRAGCARDCALIIRLCTGLPLKAARIRPGWAFAESQGAAHWPSSDMSWPSTALDSHADILTVARVTPDQLWNRTRDRDEAAV